MTEPKMDSLPLTDRLANAEKSLTTFLDAHLPGEVPKESLIKIMGTEMVPSDTYGKLNARYQHLFSTTELAHEESRELMRLWMGYVNLYSQQQDVENSAATTDYATQS